MANEIMLWVGIGLLALGGLVALFGAAGILGKKKVAGAAALLLIVAGLIGGAMGGLFAPLTAAPPTAVGPTYEVRWADSDPVESDGTTSTSVVSPDFKIHDMLDNDTNLGTSASYDVLILEIQVARVDAGDADDQQTVYLDIGSVDSITDVSAGATYTIIDYDDTTESYDAVWTAETSGFNVGLVSGNRYYTSLSPGDIVDFDVTIDINEGAFGTGPSIVGSIYSVTFVAAGQVLTWNIVVSAA